MGVSDHMLFTTADVVNQGDVVRVCRTIRNLALCCQQEGVDVPVFATAEQEQRARRSSMSKEATHSKVNKFEQKESGGRGKRRALRQFVGAVILAVVGYGLVQALPKQKRFYVVREGDNLTRVAQQIYGSKASSDKLDKIVRENAIDDRDKIFPKMRLQV